MTVVKTPVIEVQTLASGSSGNLTVVRSNGTTLLVDIGISSQRGTRQALAAAGIDPAELAAIVISHSHSDHLGYAGLRVAVEANVPVMAGAAAARHADRLYQQHLSCPLPHGVVHEIRGGATFLVGGIEVTPFAVSHDVPTFGFEFAVRSSAGVRRLAIATDLGHAPDDLLPHFADADVILIEANYNEDLLRTSPRSADDKARVASDRGHLSNVQCGRFLRRVAEVSERLPSAIVLVHLSHDHNRPALATAEVARAAGLAPGSGPVAAAPRFDPGPRISI